MNTYKNEAYLISLEKEIKEIAFKLSNCIYWFEKSKNSIVQDKRQICLVETQIVYMKDYLKTLTQIYQHEKSKEPEQDKEAKNE